MNQQIMGTSRNQRRNNNVMVAAQYSGPLPPADQLVRYNDAVPNAAERILVMAEQQSAHRRNLETKALSSDTFRATLGLIFGFVLALITVAGSIYLIMNNQGYFGVGLFGATLAGIVGTFVYGTKNRRRERESKAH